MKSYLNSPNIWWTSGELNSELINANDKLYRLTTGPRFYKFTTNLGECYPKVIKIHGTNPLLWLGEV